MRLRAVAVGLLLALAQVSAASAEGMRYAVRVEGGSEQDTNPGRVETIQGVATTPAISSPLARLLVSTDVVAAVSARQTLSLSGSVAGKRFFQEDARGEDVLVAQLAGSWARSFGQSTRLGLGGAYYDVWQRQSVTARDFRSATPVLRLEQILVGGVLVAGAGHRWFVYKPNDTFWFSGPTALLDYRRAIVADDVEEGAADWDWNVGGSAELRDFAGLRCVTAVACGSAASSGSRADRFFTAHLSVTRTGSFLVGAGLAAHLNRSNSYGETLARGLVNVRAAVLLPWGWALTTRGEIIFTRYADPIPLAAPNDMSGTPMASIEDESRSTFRLEIARSIREVVDFGARYTFYTNAIGRRSDDVDYRRQTFLLFAAFAYSNDR
jgi:hypothetical protein